MSKSLPTRLDDLAADIRAADVPVDLASQAWAAGRRRQRRSRVLTTGVAVVVLLLAAFTMLPVVGAGLPIAPSSAGDDADTVCGLPAADRPPVARRRPALGEPMAALLQRDQNGEIGWYAVSASGRRCRLPGGGTPGGVFPTLSPDGRYVGYLAPAATRTCCVTWSATRPAPSRTSARRGRGRGLQAVAGAPAFWSPDGSRLLLPADPRDGGRTSGLLLGLDRTVTPVVGDQTSMAGLTDGGQVVRVDSSSAGSSS